MYQNTQDNVCLGVQNILSIREVLPMDQAKALDTGQHPEQLVNTQDLNKSYVKDKYYDLY